MVISGIWGCANTFASAAFTHAQPHISISHHLHAPAQVIQAARLNIPCIVLVRHPIDALASLITRNGAEYSIRGLSWALKDYACYYETILEYRDHYVIADFREVVTNFPASIQRVNEKFGTAFHVPHNNSDKAKEIVKHNKISGVLRRYAVDDIKEFIHLPELRKYRLHAESVYEQFCTSNGVPMWKDPPRPPFERRNPKEAPATS